MDEEIQCKELACIFNEYRAYFANCELELNRSNSSTSRVNSADGDRKANISGRANRKNIQNGNNIRLETSEGSTMRVSVNVSGWYEIGEGDDDTSIHKHYETFEALMMNKSKGFQDRFGNALSNQLHELLNQKSKAEL